MRRRNAKKVAFADPTYYEPSENDYSTEGENEDDLDFLTVADVVHEGNLEDLQQQRMDESDIVEPLHVRSARNGQKGGVGAEEKDSTSGSVTPQPDEPPRAQEDASRASSDTLDMIGLSHISRLLPLLTIPDENGVAKSGRKMRNTDSFYKDENIETKKINLTPSLLRDDGSATAAAAPQPLEVIIRTVYIKD